MSDLLELEIFTGWVGFAIAAVVIAVVCFLVILAFGRKSTATVGTPQEDDLSEELARLRGMLKPRGDVSRDEEQIGPELLQAGYYRPGALSFYLTLRTFLVAIPLSLTAFLAISAPTFEMRQWILIGGAVLTALGFSVPRLIVSAQARSRKRAIERGLPVALDLITLGLIAGQNVQSAFGRVAIELKRGFPELAEEMTLTLKQAELNTFPHAMDLWATRSGIPEIGNLSITLSQGDRLGTDISTGLLELSQTFRTNMRQRADSQANKAGFWMLFPTILCLWIPAALMIAAPVILQFQEERRKAAEASRLPNSPPGSNLNQQINRAADPNVGNPVGPSGAPTAP